MQIRHGTWMAVAMMMLGTCLVSTGAKAEELSAGDAAKANNPLADITAFNVQNYYVPKLYGVEDEIANTFWARFAQPTGPVLWRASLPLPTIPSAESPISGVGDLQLFAAWLAVSKPELTFGIGPQFVFPTASKDALGTGKYQAGLATVLFAVPSPKVQYGGLLLWQTSFAGDDDRNDTNLLALQPFGFWQLGGGTYLRTAPIWAFDLENKNYNVPFGFGVGQVIRSGNTVYNIFIEPQFTILHDGVGQPAFQLYMALNMQFSK